MGKLDEALEVLSSTDEDINLEVVVDDLENVKEVVEKSEYKNFGQIRVTDGPEKLSNVNDPESRDIKVKDLGEYIDSLIARKQLAE